MSEEEWEPGWSECCPPRHRADSHAWFTSKREPRLLGARVDYLQIAFRVEFDPEFIRQLGARSVRASKHGCCSIQIGEWTGELRALREGKWNLRNAAQNIKIDERADGAVVLADGATTPGWTVDVVVSGKYLADHDWRYALVDMLRTVKRFGRILEVRTRRVDLAADFEFMPGEDIDCGKLVKRSNCKFKPFRRGAGDWDVDTHLATVHHGVGLHRDGFVVAPGNEISLRVYNKTTELQDKRDDDKEDAERANWALARWHGGDVTRVEFQVRGAALEELGARVLAFDPEGLDDDDVELGYRRTDARARGESAIIAAFGARLDAMWGYLTMRPNSTLREYRKTGAVLPPKGWIRLSDPLHDKQRLTRAPTHKWWKAIQDVVFVRAGVEPARRVRRVSTGARSAQVLGCVLSLLSVRGELPRISSVVREGEVIEDEREIVELLRHVAGDATRSAVKAAFVSAAAVVAEDFLAQRSSPREALEHVLTRWGAARARFAPPLPVRETSTALARCRAPWERFDYGVQLGMFGAA